MMPADPVLGMRILVVDDEPLNVELLAAIPSVIYGLWGLAVVIPITNPIGNWLNAHFGWCPLFSTPSSGRDYNPVCRGIQCAAAPGEPRPFTALNPLGCNRGYNFVHPGQIKTALAINCSGYSAMFS